jgi:quercetin dioxygenase-like cupin family protein
MAALFTPPEKRPICDLLMLKFAPMRVWIWFPILPLLFVVGIAAPTPAEVEITAEPSHHLALENQYVRVFKVEAPPKASTLMHRHRHDYVFITLGASHISNEIEGKAPVEVELDDGETRFVTGDFAHIAHNLSDKPFRNVTIEFMRDAQRRSSGARWAGQKEEDDFSGGQRKTLFIKDGVRVSMVKLKPGGSLPKENTGGPALLVAISNMELSNGKGQREKLALEGLLWSDDAMLRTNSGKQVARFVLLEF